jgi:hypothetical protein
MPWVKNISEISLPVLAERGYLIPAVSTPETNYIRCAIVLAQSIRQYHPNANICLLTNEKIDLPLFNHVVTLPHGDQGGYANDWQVFEASPYRETIKIEADMILASEFDHWWNMFEHRDVVISQGCRDFYDNTSISRHYRKFIDENRLPDVYNAITYWRLSQTAQEFFGLVRNIFEHWDQFRRLVKFAEEIPSTDFVYAMAAEIMGRERVILPPGHGPSIVHMKKHIIGTTGENWPRELVWEYDPLRIQTVAQWGMFHYHIKDWCYE